MADIVIHAPDANWPDDFRALRATLMPLVPAGAVIHHIGSTAVPGLGAKNIIDIQVGVTALDAVDRAAFEGAGFAMVPGLVDHCPPGMDLPEPELTKIFFRSTGRPANVHVREIGRFNQRFALLCRDFLRTHPVAAEAYGLVKERLARHFVRDIDAYYDIKDPVFDIIVEGAEEWAARVGWSPPEGD
jgi:GrpB-like predicted nucleotidyltransferase (UPF0157 family)